MVEPFGFSTGSEDPATIKQGQAFPCLGDMNIVQDTGHLVRSTRLEDHLRQADAFYPSSQADGRSFGYSESIANEPSHSKHRHKVSKGFESPSPLGPENPFVCDSTRVLDNFQRHPKVGFCDSSRIGHEITRQILPFLSTTSPNRISDACQAWNPDMFFLPPSSSEDTSSAPQEIPQVYPENLRLPLEIYSTGSASEDPWNSLGQHPTSSPHPVYYNNPHHEGYGFPLGVEQGNANSIPIFQHPRPSAGLDNTHEGVVLGHTSSVLSSDGARHTLPDILTPDSSQPASTPATIALTDQPPTARPGMARCLSLGTQVNWDLKTGGPIRNVKTKKRQSDDEKAASHEIRRLGGQCDLCRNGHRQVILLFGFVLHLR